MDERFQRTVALLGEDSIERLSVKNILIFGLGGVGGYAAETLARSGIGKFTIVDKDDVDITNINRQLIALSDTVGMKKTEAMGKRMRLINPSAEVDERCCFFLPENASEFDFAVYDYVLDCVDTVTAKIEIIVRAAQAGTPVISAMGAGNRFGPQGFSVSDIYETQGDPLAKVMRRELKKRNVESLKVVYCKEKPLEKKDSSFEGVGSTAFAPAACGLMMASEVVKDLLKG